ncbi:hypothetical protein ACLEJQ_22680 [Pseudomonas sp. SMV71]
MPELQAIKLDFGSSTERNASILQLLYAAHHLIFDMAANLSWMPVKLKRP